MERVTRIGTVLLVGLLAASLFSGVAVADNHDGVDMDQLVSQYNANVDEAPGLVTNRLAGERVELRVGSGDDVATANSGSAYHFDLAGDGRITDHGEGPASDPTVRVLTSENTLEGILASDQPGTEFRSAYDDGEVEIQGVGPINTVKVETTKFAVWAGSSLGLF
ncbi:MAG: hypothetical protein ACOCQM_09200 [Natronomonas sp.]